MPESGSVLSFIPVAYFAAVAAIALAILLLVIVLRVSAGRRARPLALLAGVAVGGLFALEPAQISSRPREALGLFTVVALAASVLIAWRPPRGRERSR